MINDYVKRHSCNVNTNWKEHVYCNNHTRKVNILKEKLNQQIIKQKVKRLHFQLIVSLRIKKKTLIKIWMFIDDSVRHT